MPIIDTVGLDMDGVLVDLAGYQLAKGIPYFSKKLNKPVDKVVKNLQAYDVEDIFGVSHAERMKFWTKYIWEYCLVAKPRESASALTHKWHAEGRKVKIITSRVYVMENNALGELFRRMVYYWLDKYNIYYDEVIFCSEKNSALDKAIACEKANVSLMVDDKVENANMISQNHTVLCYSNPWNEKGLNPNIDKIDEFDEIDQYITNYEQINSRRYVTLPRKSVK